jgi:ubiquinol-cytochrome c reductase iron-sulfur subunit
VEWRGKPVWIVRRTAQMLAALQGHDANLVDPASLKAPQQPAYAANEAHGPCGPTCSWRSASARTWAARPRRRARGQHQPERPGGLAGRLLLPLPRLHLRRGGPVSTSNVPAPSNLEVPPYRFASATRLVIGDDTA